MAIVIVSIVAAIFGLLWLNAASERNHAEAQLNYNESESMVKEQFRYLSETWGDREDIDTLISESEWKVIKAGNMSADQMIAYAKTVQDAYNAQGYQTYDTQVDETNFKQAVEYYNASKRNLGEDE